ncbi:MAG: hypothetical protein KGL39_56380 [Patescibacteria group bacterium]|nr:hypothetical protein [Patescibacteria group bacterium]
MTGEADTSESNGDADRYCEALSANLHTIFFFSALSDEDKDAAAVNAIKTAIDQIGESAVRGSFGAMHSLLRDRVRRAFP